MSQRQSRSKHAVAAEVWRLMLDYTWSHRGRLFGVLKELGLTPGDMKALMVLEADQPRPMGSLAQAWDCDASNVTWMVDRLEERGYVERRMLATDRRVKTVALTALGVQAKAELLARLYEPPVGLLTLPRAHLDALRDAMAKLPASPPAHGPAGRPAPSAQATTSTPSDGAATA